MFFWGKEKPENMKNKKKKSILVVLKLKKRKIFLCNVLLNNF